MTFAALLVSFSAATSQMLRVSAADDVPILRVEGQPLAANVNRLLEGLQYLGHPLPDSTRTKLRDALSNEDDLTLQRLLDEHVLFVVSINPELRVKVRRGPADSILQQSGFTPVIVKVLNEATVTRRLSVSSPQAGPVYSGAADSILRRQAQMELNQNANTENRRRFLDVEMFDQPPMTERLSGLAVEYTVALIHSSESGQREGTIVFDIGEGTQDLGFRSQIPLLFSIRPAIPVTLEVSDHDGSPTTGRFVFRDSQGRIFPPQAKRLAPDFFFQPQIYRRSGGVVLLPPGEFQMTFGRGPEYVTQSRSIHVSEEGQQPIQVQLKRWTDPQVRGYYCGDHHIHAAGCSHYDNPTQGVTPQDMFLQVQGEGLNVGCVLTWGPCYDHQRKFFSPVADTVSEPNTILKYDLEISGFGSAALGHVCLLRLDNQTYPGSDGTSTKGWPSWTVPVMAWAKEQGGITGYPHSALHADAKQGAEWILEHSDQNGDDSLNLEEAATQVLPESFDAIDQNHDGQLTKEELTRSGDERADFLPNLTLPSMNGGGAMEIVVSTPEGVCDFISAMDTARIPEWNTWYHLLNCGFPLKLSGETDFPCMSSRRVGQGRVYVKLGDIDQLNFDEWCSGVAAGRSYVSDGFAHAFDFAVNGTQAGNEDVHLQQPGTVSVTVDVAFAEVQPRGVAYGTLNPPAGRRMSGDTVNLHAERDQEPTRGGQRTVELIVNGQVIATKQVPADGRTHSLQFDTPVSCSSWVAVRQFPQLHTNPVNVLIADAPIRASRSSAVWCAEAVRILWRNRRRFIHESERDAAQSAYERAIGTYLRIAEACPDNGLQVPALTLP